MGRGPHLGLHLGLYHHDNRSISSLQCLVAWDATVILPSSRVTLSRFSWMLAKHPSSPRVTYVVSWGCADSLGSQATPKLRLEKVFGLLRETVYDKSLNPLGGPIGRSFSMDLSLFCFASGRSVSQCAYVLCGSSCFLWFEVFLPCDGSRPNSAPNGLTNSLEMRDLMVMVREEPLSNSMRAWPFFFLSWW